MLNEGIYEQIVNNKVSVELTKLDPEEYSIELLKADDARQALTNYISHVIQQGLRYIRESFKSDQDKEALVAQIKLCNDIVEVQVPVPR